KYWEFIGPDFCGAVEHFFVHGSFSKGCNSSFIALIPKVADAKFVNQFRPISLIGCVYKVVTKILANRLAKVIADLVSDTQSAFIANRHILDGPFIINEVLNWCKRKKKQAMFFKVDFAKAYDSVRWDFVLDVLEAFGFGSVWCNWIRGTFSFARASVLVNGSPSEEFQFQCGLKQGDPLSPFLFILVMEALHLSVGRAVNGGLFKGIRLHDDLSLSHLFYADDALFLGEWSNENLRGVINILRCFHLASGLQINLNKSQVMGVGVPSHLVENMAKSIGCSIMESKFRYLGVMVGENMSRCRAWDEVLVKLNSRLSRWKAKTLSIGGRLTLLKSVLGATPLYWMSIFKVPKGVLKAMESIRSNFFKGADSLVKKISWVAWDKVLASKDKGGLGVSSLHALNRALILKWVWRFVSQDGSLWFRVIKAVYGTSLDSHSHNTCSIWSSILKEVHNLKVSGFDLLSFCSKHIGNGQDTCFWLDIWSGDRPLREVFPRMFALELNRDISVAEKLSSPLEGSFRRSVRSGLEQDQCLGLSAVMEQVSLSSTGDRWRFSLSSDGLYSVKLVRNAIDELFLPSSPVQTRCPWLGVSVCEFEMVDCRDIKIVSLFWSGHKLWICNPVLYVDDMLIIGSNDKMIKSTKDMLKSKFDMKDIGTRPELAYAVSRLCSRDYGLHYDRYIAVIEGYSDANWISDIKDSRSTSGYVFTLGGAAISWKSSKQTIIAKSMKESEFIALDKCEDEA
ncbi:RNA-directed DNA polymerase, eukaryota, partial [Tanacetum coccineum]